MISKSLLTDMHLDVRRIERERKTYESLAMAYEKWAEKQEDGIAKDNARAISASLFRRAAAHALMLGDYQDFEEIDRIGARKLFQRSASVYSDLRMPYAIFLSAFTNRIPESWEHIEFWSDAKNFERGFALVQPQMVYLLLYYAGAAQRKRLWQDDEIMNIIRQSLDGYRSLPLGILGLPVGSYLDLIDALDSERSRRNIGLDEAALPFIIRYNTAIQQAMQNDYHWRRLAMPFHPVEPDMFAVLLMVNRVMKAKQDRTIFSLVDNLPIGQESKAFLSGVLDDYDDDGRQPQSKRNYE